jgi:hypothetical protein
MLDLLSVCITALVCSSHCILACYLSSSNFTYGKCFCFQFVSLLWSVVLITFLRVIYLVQISLMVNVSVKMQFLLY